MASALLLDKENGGKAVDSIATLLGKIREERDSFRTASDDVERKTRGAEKAVEICRRRIENGQKKD